MFFFAITLNIIDPLSISKIKEGLQVTCAGIHLKKACGNVDPIPKYSWYDLVVEIAVKNSKGITLHGNLHKNRSNKTLIIICHGYNSSSKHPALVAIVDGLNHQGHATFTFDFTKGSELNLEQQVSDIRSVVNYFENYDEIILLAGSFGALTAAMATPKLSRIKGLITINGFFGSSKLGFGYSLRFIFFKLLTMLSPQRKKIWSVYKAEFRPEKISVPVFAIHSKSDEIVSYQQSEDFINQIKAVKEIRIIDDVDHHLSSSQAIRNIVSLIDVWLNKHQSR